jgi:hypothetical protein
LTGRVGDRRSSTRSVTAAVSALKLAPDTRMSRAVAAFFWSVAEATTARGHLAPSGEAFALQHTVSKGDL